MNTFAHSAEAEKLRQKMVSNTVKMLVFEKGFFSSLLEDYDLEKLPFKMGNAITMYLPSLISTDI